MEAMVVGEATVGLEVQEVEVEMVAMELLAVMVTASSSLQTTLHCFRY